MSKLIIGKSINLREVEFEDANFIYSLRINNNLSKYLSQVSGGVQEQIRYIENYKKSNNEYYFIIEDKNSLKYGTLRIYNIISDSFCWGSWIIVPNSPYYVSIQSALLVYDFAFKNLNMKKSSFDVRKGNQAVLKFHLKMGASIVKEDELNIYLDYFKEDYLIQRPKYLKFLN